MTTIEEIKAAIWEAGSVNRDHLLAFLTLQNTSDAGELSRRTASFLTGLHNDPYYSKVVFPQGDIERVLGDLSSYGRVTQETIIDAPADTITEPPSAADPLPIPPTIGELFS